MGRIRTGRIRPGLAMPVPVRPPRPSGEHEPAPCGVSGSREGQRQGAPSSRHRTSGGSRHQLGIKGSTLGSRRIRGASIAPRADSDKRCAPEQHHRLVCVQGWPSRTCRFPDRTCGFQSENMPASRPARGWENVVLLNDSADAQAGSFHRFFRVSCSSARALLNRTCVRRSCIGTKSLTLDITIGKPENLMELTISAGLRLQFINFDYPAQASLVRSNMRAAACSNHLLRSPTVPPRR